MAKSVNFTADAWLKQFDDLENAVGGKKAVRTWKRALSKSLRPIAKQLRNTLPENIDNRPEDKRGDRKPIKNLVGVKTGESNQEYGGRSLKRIRGQYFGDVGTRVPGYHMNLIEHGFRHVASGQRIAGKHVLESAIDQNIKQVFKTLNNEIIKAMP